jgi:HD-like signal output (HDOD) protein
MGPALLLIACGTVILINPLIHLAGDLGFAREADEGESAVLNIMTVLGNVGMLVAALWNMSVDRRISECFHRYLRPRQPNRTDILT